MISCSKKSKSDCKGSCKWEKGKGCKRIKDVKAKILTAINSIGVSNTALASAISNPKILDIIDDKVNEYARTQQKVFKWKPAVLSGLKTLVAVSILAAVAWQSKQKFNTAVVKEVFQTTTETLKPIIMPTFKLNTVTTYVHTNPVDIYLDGAYTFLKDTVKQLYKKPKIGQPAYLKYPT